MTRRRRVGLGVAVAVLAGAGALLPAGGLSQVAPPATRALPTLGVADSDAVMMGAAPAGQPGEAWAYRVLPADTPAPRVESGRLVFGPQPTGRIVPQLAFLRHQETTGWQIVDVPERTDGTAYRGMTPNRLSAAITPRGGGFLLGRDATRAGDDQLVALIRDVTGGWRVLPRPSELAADEALAGDQGAGRVAVGAYDAPGGGLTGLFAGALGPDQERSILHFDGASWQREPITGLPAVGGSRIVAVEATSPQNAWALVETGDEAGIELFRRVVGADGPGWRRQPLGIARFDDGATPADQLSEVGPLRDNADPLTVTTEGLWIDGTARTGTGPDAPRYDLTLYFRPTETAGDVMTSYCDAPLPGGGTLCQHPLGVAFGRGAGYRSFAFGGAGAGTRIVTNPTDRGGAPESNRGTYLRIADGAARRMQGGGESRRPSGAFTSADDGWLEGPVRISAAAPPQKLRRWPVAVRGTLTDAVPAPGAPPGSVGSSALAVGVDGAVARYAPDTGWTREFLLTSAGNVVRSRLRGVAWPAADRAHAVGDLGAMWQWRADTGLWERDPAAPLGFEGQLMDVAFQPGNPDRGYAVGRAGVLLRYDKTWTQEALPPGFESRDLTSVSFAGSQAIVVAGSDVLVNDGGGWRVEGQVSELLAEVRSGTPYLRVVAGLPDGGAVIGGRGFVIERDGAGQPWRFGDQPLPGQTVVAAAAFRAGGRVQAAVAVVPRLPFPLIDDPVQQDPDVPPPILPAQPLPGDGYLLRETATGWRDEQRTAYGSSTTDRPLKSDPMSALVLDPGTGDGWAIGGWSGALDFVGRGTPVATDRARVQTAAILRYSAEGTPPAAPETGAAPPALGGSTLRFAVGGHPQCEDACADLAGQAIAPDRMLSGALTRAAALGRRTGGPRFFVNTGGRLRPEAAGVAPPLAEQQRYAELLAGAEGLPVYTAPSAGDTTGGTSAFLSAMASSSGPFGGAPVPSGISTGGIPGEAAEGTRTHYAFDMAGNGGTLRTVVIDNSLGSLAASDPHQVPAEPQLPWLRAVLSDARAKGMVSVVVGSRDLSRLSPRLNAADDGDEVARAIVDGGASAYFFERPEETRALAIPSGGARTIPAFGTGSLGYRSPLRVSAGGDDALAPFGTGQFLLAEVDLGARDAATNVAPVTVRGMPVIDDLSLQPIDGTLLRRSRPSLFEGLGRRPEAGDRWGEIAGDGGPQPPGGDPYTAFPAEPCLIPGCDTRVTPEYEFASSDPDIADFVRQDPESANLRKPLLGADDKVISDASSGLLCPFNAGTTTVTVRAGGLSVSQKITVQDGAVARPCGTRPLNPSRFAARPPEQAPVGAPPAPPPAPAASPAADLRLAPPPALQPDPFAPPAPPSPARPTPQPPGPPTLDPLLPPPPSLVPGLPPTPIPPVGAFAQPIPPAGVGARVLEEKREEEAAPEQQSAFSRFALDDHGVGPALFVGCALAAALAGTGLARARGTSLRRRREEVALVHIKDDRNPARRRP